VNGLGVPDDVVHVVEGVLPAPRGQLAKALDIVSLQTQRDLQVLEVLLRHRKDVAGLALTGSW